MPIETIIAGVIGRLVKFWDKNFSLSKKAAPKDGPVCVEARKTKEVARWNERRP